MPKYNLTWTETDAQLLEAILLATGGEGGAPLQEVLLMADAVGGTVFTLQEVEQGLEKLMAVGYATLQNKKLLLQSAFLHDYEATVAGSEDEQRALLQLLQTKPLVPEDMDAPKILIKKYKLKSQYEAYQEQFGG